VFSHENEHVVPAPQRTRGPDRRRCHLAGV